METKWENSFVAENPPYYTALFDVYTFCGFLVNKQKAAILMHPS